MKMRQKLVAVLAASMVVTSVPVITMAETTNTVSVNRYAKKDTTYGFLKATQGGNTYVYGQNTIGQSVTGGYDYRYSNGFEFTPKMDYYQPGTMYMSVTKDTEFDAQAIITYVDAFNNTGAPTNSGVSKLYVGSDNKIHDANTAAYNGKTVDEVINAGVTMFFRNPGGTGVANPALTTTPISSAGLTNAIATALRTHAADIYTAEVSDNELAQELAKEIFKKLGIKNTTEAETANVDAASIVQATEWVLESVVSKNAYSDVTTTDALVTTDSFYAAGKINENFTTVVNNAIRAFVGLPTTTPTVTVRKVESFDVKDPADREYNKHLRVDFFGNFNAGVTYKTPLLAKIGGDKVAILNIDGYDSFISNGRYNLTQDVVSDQRTTVTADSEKIRVNEMDAIGKIKIKETSIGSLIEGGKNRKVKITLPSSSDLQFNLSKTLSSAVATGKRGFYSTTKVTAVKNNKPFLDEAGYVNNSAAYVEQLGRALATSEQLTNGLRISYDVTSRRNSYTDVDKQTLIIELPYWTDATSTGEIELTGIYVEPVNKTANVGDVNVTFEEYLAPGWSSSSTVSTYQEATFDGNGDYVIYPNVQYYELVGGVYTPNNYSQSATKINRSTKTLYVVGSGVNTVSGVAAKSSNLVKTTTLKVGEVAEYALKLTCKDNPMKTVKAGRSGIQAKNKVTFELEENVKDSLVDSRKVEFNLENGYIFGPADVDYTDKAANSNGFVTTGIYGSTNYKQKALAKFKELIANKTIEFAEKADTIDQSSIELNIDADGRVTGFSARYPKLNTNSADKLKVTIPVATDVMTAGDQFVKVSANNVYTRSFLDKPESPTCDIADVIAPIDVTFDGAKLKVGKQNQEAGTITIKETDKGMLEKGWLFLAADNQAGITFDNIPTVTVKGDDAKKLTVSNVELSKDKTMLGIEITKASADASTIEITGINLTADRTVPQANYALAIWGSAITDENELGITNFTQNALYSQAYFNQASDIYSVKDFIQMTTANTEDLSSAAKAVTTKFVIGESKFTVNGEEVKMDSKAYIKDGLTFVPVRYLAQAFGISGTAVQYDKATSTATIVSGDKVVNITNGKAYLVVNGTQVPMTSKAEIGKDGRMCVPMAYIAAALGIQKDWNPATKTATFTNQAK